MIVLTVGISSIPIALLSHGPNLLAMVQTPPRHSQTEAVLGLESAWPWLKPILRREPSPPAHTVTKVTNIIFCPLVSSLLSTTRLLQLHLFQIRRADARQMGERGDSWPWANIFLAMGQHIPGRGPTYSWPWAKPIPCLGPRHSRGKRER